MQHRTITRVHPHTGVPLEPVYITRHGVARYPILGASEDDPSNGGGDGSQNGAGGSENGAGGSENGGGGGEGTGGGGEGAGGGDGAGGDGEVDLGFPKDTAIKDMTTEQREKYWEHHAKKHERAWQSKRLVEMTPDQLKAIVDENEKLKREHMSENERALADARAEGEQQGREAALTEQRDRSLGYLDGHIDAFINARGLQREDYEDFLDSLDRSKFLTPDGDVDTDKVARVIGGALGSKQPGTQRWPDMGQGNRGSGTKSSGKDAGQAEAQRRFQKSGN